MLWYQYLFEVVDVKVIGHDLEYLFPDNAVLTKEILFL